MRQTSMVGLDGRAIILVQFGLLREINFKAHVSEMLEDLRFTRKFD